MTDMLKPGAKLKRDEGPSISFAADYGRRPRRTSVFLRYLAGSMFLLGCAIVTFILLAAVIELASRAIWRIHPEQHQAELENQAASPIYAGADWAPEFWKEESLRRKTKLVYVPFRLWSVTDWHSQYINNDSSVRGIWRRTVNPNCNSAKSVWMFGGSTMYGTGVPDWATVPSYLSQDLNRNSKECVTVFNFGVEGYVTDQELILLEEQLKKGGRPDLVIFYDGVNDSSLAFAPSGTPMPHFSVETIKSRVEGSFSGRFDFLQKSYSARVAGQILAALRPAKSFQSMMAKSEPAIGSALNNYEQNLRIVRALGEAYHFQVYCFWQPIVTFGHKPLAPFEQHMVDRDLKGDSADSEWFLVMNVVYREAEQHAANPNHFVFLAHLFDNVKEPLYVDEAHLGPLGNQIVANAIANYLQSHPPE